MDTQPNPSYEELRQRLGEVECRLAQLEAKLETGAVAPAVAPPPLPQTFSADEDRVADLAALSENAADAVRSLSELESSVAESEPAQEAAGLQKVDPEEWAKLVAIDEESAKASSSAPAKPSIGLEQQIGQKWMLLAGMGVLLLGGMFFFKFALERGWVPTPPVRCLIGVIVAAGMFLFGERVFRQGKTMFATGLFSVATVLLYFISWVASPNGLYTPEYNILSMEMAFACMCAVTVLGVAMAIRSNFFPGVVFTLVGALATPLMLSTGENHQVAFLSYLLVVNAGYLLVSFWRRWPGLARMVTLGTWVLVFGWFSRYGDESPIGLTAGFAWAFAATGYCAAVFAARSKRLMIVRRWFLVLGTLCMGVIWLGLEFSPAEYCSHVFAVAAVLCLMSLRMSWRDLSAGSLGWTLVLMMGGLAKYKLTADMSGAVQWGNWEHQMWCFGWALALWHIGVAVFGHRRKLLNWPEEQILVAATAMTWLWLGLEINEALMLVSTFLLTALVLALGYSARWNRTRVLMLGAAIFALATGWDQSSAASGWTLAGHTIWYWVPALWVLATLFATELGLAIFRAPRRGLWARFDGVMILITTVGAFAATLGILYWEYEAWMGGYSLAGMVACFGLSWVYVRYLKHTIGKRMYLLAGLAMLLTAVPMQLSDWAVTVGWVVLALGLLWTAKRVRSITVLSAPLAAIVLAAIHFVGWEIQNDGPMREVAFTLFGVGVSYLLLLGVGIAASALALAVGVQHGRRLLPAEAHAVTCGALLVLAAALLVGSTLAWLPAMTATYWIVAGALVALALGGGLRQQATAVVGVVQLFLAASFFAATMVITRIDEGANVDRAVVLNWQVLLGVVFIVSLAKGVSWAACKTELAKIRVGLFQLAAVILLVMLGSFEVDRYVQCNMDWIDDAFKATQMGLSLWWASVAAALLIGGFAAKCPRARYTAIALFGLTLAKVFLVDMQGIDAAYRILSFMGIGALLMAGSWLYHRSYKAASAAPCEPDDTPSE